MNEKVTIIDFLYWLHRNYVLCNGEYFHKDAPDYLENAFSYEMLAEEFLKNRK